MAAPIIERLNHLVLTTRDPHGDLIGIPSYEGDAA